MYSKITYVEIVFENLDYIAIPARYFKDFFLDINIEANREQGAYISCSYRMEALRFVLKKEVNDVGRSLRGDVHSIEYYGETLFERIYNYKDICCVKLIYDDRKTEEYCVEWEDEDGCDWRNQLQKSGYDPEGNLYVEVQPSSGIDIAHTPKKALFGLFRMIIWMVRSIRLQQK